MAQTLRFVVPPESDGVKLKVFLRGHCALSYRLMVSLKHVENGITANGGHIRVIDRVRAGDVIELHIPDDPRPAVPIPDKRFQVLYEDDQVLVLDKPPAMAVHPSPGHYDGTLANAVAAYLAQKEERGAFRPINRLDRDTSGIVVAAKNAYAAARLHGHVEKEYVAVVNGVLSGEGTIDLPIRRREGFGVMREVGEGGDRCVTHWKAQESGQGMTKLSIRLETGRTHQIRVHFSHLGMPLVGDTMYGTASPLIARQALHCRRACFLHPVTREAVRVVSEYPTDMQALFAVMRQEE